MSAKLYTCACCGFATLPERGCYRICAVCYWEDDLWNEHHPDEVSFGPNRISLAEARRNYQSVKACHPSYVAYVRAPKAKERRAHA